MLRQRAAPFVLLLLLACCIALAPRSAAAQAPPIDVGNLSNGRFARMHAMLERTFMELDVLRVDIRFDRETTRRIERLARNQRYSEERAWRIAYTCYRADDAYARTRFERHVELDEFIASVRANLRRAWKAKMITEANYRSVSGNLARWFGSLRERGFEEGDWLLFRARPESLRIVLMDAKGKELLDRTEDGAGPRLALLAGYFAPGGELSDGLIRSILPD